MKVDVTVRGLEELKAELARLSCAPVGQVAGHRVSTALGGRTDLPCAVVDRLVVTQRRLPHAPEELGSVISQIAEVAVPRTLFVEILRQIDRLRPSPPQLAA
jgi:hypothetical protein